MSLYFWFKYYQCISCVRIMWCISPSVILSHVCTTEVYEGHSSIILHICGNGTFNGTFDKHWSTWPCGIYSELVTAHVQIYLNEKKHKRKIQLKIQLSQNLPQSLLITVFNFIEYRPRKLARLNIIDLFLRVHTTLDRTFSIQHNMTTIWCDDDDAYRWSRREYIFNPLEMKIYFKCVNYLRKKCTIFQ